MIGRWDKASHRAAMLAGILGLGVVVGSTGAARAQFWPWDQPRYSADDIARMAIRHGYRPLAQPTRNDDNYVADVLDQRGRRERLIISADTGEVLQRFMLDSGRGYRRYVDPSIPSGPVPPGRIPEEDNRNLLSRLTPDDRGTDQNFGPGEPERSLPPRPPHHRRPHAAVQQPETVRPAAPVESAPLSPPPQTPPALHNPAPAAPAPAQAVLPPANAPAAPASPPSSSPAPSDKPGRAISRDPLAIPGSRAQDEEQAAAKAAAKPATGASAAPKPAPKVSPAVPIAPLE